MATDVNHAYLLMSAEPDSVLGSATTTNPSSSRTLFEMPEIPAISLQRTVVFFAFVRDNPDNARRSARPPAAHRAPAAATFAVARPAARRGRRVHLPPRALEDVAERHRPGDGRGAEHREPQGGLGRQRRAAQIGRAHG